jgi:predicted PurR-regulated permease PerM
MDKQVTNTNIYETTIRLFILLLIIAWCLMILYPFVSIILWSLILAMAFYPLHSLLSKKIGGNPKLASFIITFTVIGIFIIPTFFLVGSITDEVKQLKSSFDAGTLTIPPPTSKVKEWPVIGNKVFETWQVASVSLSETIIKYGDQLTKVGSKLVKGVLGAAGDMLQIIASLIIAGILLVVGGAGEAIRKFFRKLAGSKGDEFADIILKTVSNVVKGIIGVALILAVLHGVLFLLAGIPYAGIWTLLIFVLAILQVPLLIVTLPLIIYMFAVKETVPAVIWTVLLLMAGTADNFLKPLLLGKGAPVPMLVIFIGVIGGFILSGFIGLFTGAIVMSIGYKLFEEWMTSNNETEKI